MTDTELVAVAAEAYLYHRAWRNKHRPPNKCPKPSGGKIIDRELDARGITERPERDHVWAALAGEAFEAAEHLHESAPKTGQRREYFLTNQPGA